jgi:outer membrane protein TolC
LLGIDTPTGKWTAGDSIEQVMISPPEMAAMTNAARPDVLAAEADLRSARANLDLQKALRIPDPTFLAQFGFSP